jgi:hypothetical protein
MPRQMRKTQAFPKMLISANPCDNFILMTDNVIYSAFTLYKIFLPPALDSIFSLSILETEVKTKFTIEKRYITYKNFLLLEN